MGAYVCVYKYAHIYILRVCISWKRDWSGMTEETERQEGLLCLSCVNMVLWALFAFPLSPWRRSSEGLDQPE